MLELFPNKVMLDLRVQCYFRELLAHKQTNFEFKHSRNESDQSTKDYGHFYNMRIATNLKLIRQYMKRFVNLYNFSKIAPVKYVLRSLLNSLIIVKYFYSTMWSFCCCCCCIFYVYSSLGIEFSSLFVEISFKLEYSC